MEEQDLGEFALSLAVDDLQLSRFFYQRLGFEVIVESGDDSWLMMMREGVLLGLYEGLFDRNFMTFMTDDVLAAQEDLKGKDVDFLIDADPASAGFRHAIIADPDGNQILLLEVADDEG